jgi:hypothetical protein
MEANGQLQASVALPPGKGSRYLVDRKLGSRAGLDAVEYRRMSGLYGEYNPGCPACSSFLYIFKI